MGEHGFGSKVDSLHGHEVDSSSSAHPIRAPPLTTIQQLGKRRGGGETAIDREIEIVTESERERERGGRWSNQRTEDTDINERKSGQEKVMRECL